MNLLYRTRNQIKSNGYAATKNIYRHTHTHTEGKSNGNQTNKQTNEKKKPRIYEVLPLLFDHKIIIIGKKEGERAKDLMMMMMIFVRENIKKKMKKIIVYHTHTHSFFMSQQTNKKNAIRELLIMRLYVCVLIFS